MVTKKLRADMMKLHPQKMAGFSKAVVLKSKSVVVRMRARVAPAPNLQHQQITCVPRHAEVVTEVRSKAANGSEDLGSVEPALSIIPSQDVPVESTSRRTLRQCFRASVWLQALPTLAIFLLNTLACVVFAWLLNFVLAFGNVFSGRSVAHQTDFEFAAGVAFVGHSGFYVVNLVIHTHVLLRLQFVELLNTGSPRASFAYCFRRLFVRSKFAYVMSTVVLASGLLIWDSLADVARGWKLEYYVNALSGQIFCSGITVAVRNVFRQETVQGRSRYPGSSPTSMLESFRVFAKAFVVTSPRLWVTVLAGMYIQATSKYQVIGSWHFVIYTAGSHILKIVMREMAKRGIARLHIKDPRSIFFAVGLPTVLIDTQVRVMLQRGQTASFTIMWTIGMAAFEILSRLVAVLITKRKLHRKELAVRRSMQQGGGDLRGGDCAGSSAQARTDNDQVRSPNTNAADAAATSSGADALERFEKWKRQILAFQIAESYASMSAEYIAIGCSSSILFFYWDHPKYELGRNGGGDPGDTGASSVWSRGYAICSQVGVEIVVDYLSCVLEISEGIDFQPIQKYRGYLGLLFVGITALNIQICAQIYFNDNL